MRVARVPLSALASTSRSRFDRRRADVPLALRAGAKSDASTSDDARAWERFYLAHSRGGSKADVSFFKDRHYLRRAFSELADADARQHPEAFRAALTPSTLGAIDEEKRLEVLELGCGVGNSVYPLLRANLNMRVTAVDCSPTAIATLEKSPEYDPRRLRTHVVDASQAGSMVGRVDDASIDAVTAVFFFSALTTSGLRNAAEEVRRILRPNGILLLRDYARGDVKNSDETSRFVPGERIDGVESSSEQMYRRGDGTLAVFFDPEELNEAFTSVGLIGECEIVTHTVTNRKLGVVLERKFVQGRFVKPTA